MPIRSVMLILWICALVLAPAAARARPPLLATDVQAFLDAQPGILRSYRDGDHSAAEWIEAVSGYYSVSPRVLLALLEASNALLSDPAPTPQALRHPLNTAAPAGFGAQLDWAASDIRANFGPFASAPVVRFTDGTTATLDINQAPEGVAVQHVLAVGRTQAEWRVAATRFVEAFGRYFNNELPEEYPTAQPSARGFLGRPWPAGTHVSHLAFFDHAYPTVDTHRSDNGVVVDYLGRGNVQYDGHDGHDYVFPDKPTGTFILAAADGIAYARTHRGNGVVIRHANGYETVYWHLDRFAKLFAGKVDTNQGVRVRAGDLLGSSGRSGFVSGTPHLHFEVRHNGREVDPYGWSGPGADPCPGYAACETSVWLWNAALAGEFDWTPPTTRRDDTRRGGTNP